MEQPQLLIKFAEHLPLDKVAGMVSGIAAYGNVEQSNDARTLVVSIFRPSKLQGLKDQLASWEHHGFLRWTEAT
jgi:hypothetical protein